MKIALMIAVVLILGIGALELALRVLLGFGRPPLYVADSQTGYRLAPNQRTRRFGNEIAINQYSMRSPGITPLPDADTLRILLLGDSITNGGWWTDQSDILSAQIERQLAGENLGDFSEVEVLNASANSWGPRNELAYLSKFGPFGSHIIVLVLNTDDLFATTPTSVQVGRDPNYPNTYPPAALAELLGRFKKTKPIPELEAIRQEGGDRVGVNLAAIRQIHRLTQESNAQLIVVLTPLLREVMPPGSRDYEVKARQRLTQLTHEEKLVYIDFLNSFKDAAQPESLYRDHIHLSQEGNAVVCQTISQTILKYLLAPETFSFLPDSLLDDPW